jgi:hypothetical protein
MTRSHFRNALTITTVDSYNLLNQATYREHYNLGLLFSLEDRLCYGASASEAFFDLYRQA